MIELGGLIHAILGLGSAMTSPVVDITKGKRRRQELVIKLLKQLNLDSNNVKSKLAAKVNQALPTSNQ